MLILSRKTNETLKIDGPCTITVVKIGRHRVSIGIEADKDVGIVRGELPERKKPELKGEAEV